MKKIAFVIPWSGKLPNYFPLWSETCKNNPTIDFFIFTSEPIPCSLPTNVKYVPFDFDQLKVLFQSHFDFPIALNSPYKFCDFKPAYGEIFAEYLRPYDFWGHCDIDLLWGNIRHFVTDEQLSQYDRLYTRGHCCLYRNTPKVNSWYRTLPHDGLQDWRQVFQNPESFCFDEWHQGGLSEIIKQNHLLYYDGRDMADLDISKGVLSPHGFPNFQTPLTYFELQNGVLWMCALNSKKEVLYCHFQKRPLEIGSYDPSHLYLIAPGKVTSNPAELSIRHRMKELEFEARYYSSRIQNKLKKLKK